MCVCVPHTVFIKVVEQIQVMSLILSTIFFISALAASGTYGGVVPHSSVLCECYNANNSTTDEVCKSKQITCSADRGGCYAVWDTSNVTGKVHLRMKGCWTNEGSCSNAECIDNTSVNRSMKFCCCNGDLCNAKYRFEATTVAPQMEENTLYPKQADELNWLLVFGIVIGIAFIVIVLIIVLCWIKRNSFNKVPTNEPDLHSSNLLLTQNRPIDLLESKARGRFGTVHRAILKPEGEIAVKVLPSHDKESWLTEQSIFMLPRMKHPNILEFIGVEKHLDKSQYWLITAYHNHGSLCDYLKAHTVTWSELCRIAESMARGLMHLHEQISASKTEGLKPAVAHRDFKSKNVLLKSDLTACIADFGLALIFRPDVPCVDKSHGQVGTRRYMAPEVLDGAIEFTCNAYLRIDMYACGLVLWELVSRCTIHGEPVPEYMLPFEAELGLHPTLEAMKDHVLLNSRRPAIPDLWRNHNGLNAMCKTMEECWDYDADARLTASCVIERISRHTRYVKTELLIETNASIKDNGDSIK